jgi:hypothetical protein
MLILFLLQQTKKLLLDPRFSQRAHEIPNFQVCYTMSTGIGLADICIRLDSSRQYLIRFVAFIRRFRAIQLLCIAFPINATAKMVLKSRIHHIRYEKFRPKITAVIG